VENAATRISEGRGGEMTEDDFELDQCVKVVWKDSSMLDGWIYDLDEPEWHLKRITTVGFVCRVDQESLTLTSSSTKTGGFMSPLKIPLCCIEQAATIELPA
jgi:hypothetical protein